MKFLDFVYMENTVAFVFLIENLLSLKDRQRKGEKLSTFGKEADKCFVAVNSSIEIEEELKSQSSLLQKIEINK